MERQVPDRQPTIEQAMLYQVKMREIRQAIEALPAKQRAAVISQVRRVGVFSNREGVGLFGIGGEVVLFRAYETLRARWRTWLKREFR